jgi:hypothetical protein
MHPRRLQFNRGPANTFNDLLTATILRNAMSFISPYTLILPVNFFHFQVPPLCFHINSQDLYQDLYNAVPFHERLSRDIHV